MPDNESNDPGDGTGINVLVPGDNAPNEGEEETMDLPNNIGTLIISETGGNIQANNRDGRNVGTVALGVLQLAAARNFDELGTVEGRANSGVNATPIASPATKSGG